MYTLNLDSKAFTEGGDTTCSGNWFHLSITRREKFFFRSSRWSLHLNSFFLWPLRSLALRVKKVDISPSSSPDNNLYTCTILALCLCLLNSRVGRSRCLKRWLFGCPLMDGINFVALLCTTSINFFFTQLVV